MSRLSTIRGLLLAGLTLVPLAAAQAQTSFNLAVVTNLNSSNVSVINTTTNVEVARIATGPRPFFGAMSPDGQFAYIGEDGFGNPRMRINRINLSTLVVEARLTLNGPSYMVDLEISPDGRWLVAGEIEQATIYIVDAQTWTVAHKLVLCPTCNGQTTALYSAPSFSFSADSRTLYSATNGNNLFHVVDLATGTVVETRPAQNSFGSPYPDLETGANENVFVAHPDSTGTVRRFDVPGGGSSDLALGQPDIGDIALISRAGTNLIAAGSIVYDPNPDHLSVLDLGTSVLRQIPSSESLRNLRYNPVRNELWATCVGAVGYCVPYVIDVFDLSTFTRRGTIQGPGSASILSRAPALSADFKYYYQPLDTNRVLVINAATLQIVKQITVGSNPRGVFIQGDTTPRELM